MNKKRERKLDRSEESEERREKKKMGQNLSLFIACCRYPGGEVVGLNEVGESVFVKRPIDFKHYKEDNNGQLYMKKEKGKNNMTLKMSPIQQKFIGKQSPVIFNYYDHSKDMKNDPFRSALSAKELKKLEAMVLTNWENNVSSYDGNNSWFFVMEGEDVDGNSAVSLWQDREEFEKKRDEFYDKDTKTGYSHKAAMFYSLEDAQLYIQMARDEEGTHYDWGEEVEVYWQKGPFCAKTGGWNPVHTFKVITEEEHKTLILKIEKMNENMQEQGTKIEKLQKVNEHMQEHWKIRFEKLEAQMAKLLLDSEKKKEDDEEEEEEDDEDYDEEGGGEETSEFAMVSMDEQSEQKKTE